MNALHNSPTLPLLFQKYPTLRGELLEIYQIATDPSGAGIENDSHRGGGGGSGKPQEGAFSQERQQKRQRAAAMRKLRTLTAANGAREGSGKESQEGDGLRDFVTFVKRHLLETEQEAS